MGRVRFRVAKEKEMQEYQLSGDHYEMGRLNALLMRRAGYPTQETVTPRQLRFARECEAAVGEHAPWLIEEVRGVEDAGVFDPGVVKVLPLTLYADPGCSAVAVSGRHTRDGKPLFGRNYDFFASFGKYNSLYKTRPEGKLAHIGCSDQWVGRHDGLNEAGLAIGHSGPPGREQRPGFVITLAIRAVLDTCRTVSEAAAFLERIPHLGNTSYLVADATGEIAAVDASPGKVVTTRFPDGFGFLANANVSQEMAAYAPDEEVSRGRTRARNLRNWFAARSTIGMGDVQRVPADPRDGVCACAMGGGEAENPAVTLWSWTAAPGDAVVYLAKGTPSETPYEPAAL
jgi:hypothetical protein